MGWINELDSVERRAVDQLPQRALGSLDNPFDAEEVATDMERVAALPTRIPAQRHEEHTQAQGKANRSRLKTENGDRQWCDRDGKNHPDPAVTTNAAGDQKQHTGYQSRRRW